MSIPVPQPVQPATDLSESDYWLGFEALQKWGYKVDLGPIDPGLAAKMQRSMKNIFEIVPNRKLVWTVARHRPRP